MSKGTQAMKYTIDRLIGRGSFGEVFEAHDPAGNRYAIKAVARGDAMCTALLRKEFEFLSSLDHKRILKVMDFDLNGPAGPIMVAEMVDGVDLKAYVEASGIEHLPLITAKVIDGLRYLHGLGRVHGDFKPDSVLVYEEDGRPEVKLIDAGLDIGEGSNLPTLAGTPAYMAPEIIRNLKADGRSDLYSLGVTLYEVLTGEIPFAGKNEAEALSKHLEYQPPPPSRVNPRVGSAWDGFTAKLMEKEPLRRYRDADQAGLDLERVFCNPNLYLSNLMLPRSDPLVARHEQTERVVGLLTPPCAKGVLLLGERGCGVSRVLRRVGSLAKIRGQRVFAVTLNEEMPAIAQVVEAVLKSEVKISGTGGSPVSGDSSGEAACFTEILDSFRANLPEDHESILIIDGGEAMEPHELRFLGELPAEVGGRLGVVVGYRSQGANAASPLGSHSFETIEVAPLGANAVERVLAWHFGTPALPTGFAEEMYHATGGNPGLLDLTLDHLWDCGSLSFCRDNGSVHLDWDGKIEVPASVKLVVSEKLGDLTVSAIQVLKIVFAGGGWMETDVLSDRIGRGELYSALEDLAGSGLIVQEGGRIGLKTGRDSLAEPLMAFMKDGELADISLRVAGVLKERVGGAYDYYRLGMLYLQGGRYDEAFRYLNNAGGHFARFSIRDALLAYGKALECPVDPGLSASVSEKIGDLELECGNLEKAGRYFGKAASLRPSALRKSAWAVGLRGGFDESVGILRQCEKDALDSNDEVEAARVRSDLGYIYAMESRTDMSLEVLEQARDVFEARDMLLEAGIASNRIGSAEYKVGDFKGAAAAWTEARAYFARAGDRKRAAMCQMSLGLCARKQMDFEGAEACFKDALAVFDDINAIGEKASCQQNYAVLLLDQGDLSGATALAERALAVGNLLGRRSAVVTATILLAALRLETGDWEEARTRLSGLLDTAPPPDVFQRSMITRYLALAASVAGLLDKAEESTAESLALAREAEDSEGRGQALLAKATLMLRGGHWEKAAALAAEALDGLIAAGSLLLANEARRVLGEALCEAGRRDEGMPRLLEAADGFRLVPKSVHMGRVIRALALAYHLDGDRASFVKHFGKAMEVFRAAGARYEYALTLLLGGREALAREGFLQTRRYLSEAARLFRALKIDDLHKEAVREMEKIPSNELETKAVASLSRIAQTLNSSHDLSTVLNQAMDLAIEYVGAERGMIMLEDEATGELSTYARRAIDQDSVEEVIDFSQSIVDLVRSSGAPVIASDATRDARFKNSRSVKTHNIMSVMCLPLLMGDKLLGIIYLDSRSAPAGLSDLEKSFVQAFTNQVSLAIVNARMFGKLYDDITDLRRRADEKHDYSNIIGPGKKMQEVFWQVEKASKSTIEVLITGESGTGKELVAGLVHELSPRRNKPFIVVNCAAIQQGDLLESMLFGIAKSVATGVSARSGYFERAHEGTIFLDEVGDMPLATQTKVFRVLEDGVFERVGGSRAIKVDVRVISATNQDLKHLIDEGKFRAELYYRLYGMHIHVPPLRERIEDLRPLTEYFLRMYTEKNSKPEMTISKEVYGLLRRNWWRGNVRELEKCIEHAVTIADGAEILPEHLPAEMLDDLRDQDMRTSTEFGLGSLQEQLQALERRLIIKALRESNGVKTQAARALHIHESTLRKKAKQYNIKIDRGR